VNAVSVILIRHGETPANRERVVQVPETPLSERGRRQAQLLAERLAAHPIEGILCSDLARAQETGATLARALGLELELDEGLQERNFGDLRGTAYRDLAVDLFGPDYQPPGGESWAEFDARVDDAWGRVEERVRSRVEPADGSSGSVGSRGAIAVVTHGLVCHSVVTRLAHPRPVSPGGIVSFGNTSVTLLEAGQRPGAAWQIQLINCTRHLETEDFLSPDEGISGL